MTSIDQSTLTRLLSIPDNLDRSRTVYKEPIPRKLKEYIKREQHYQCQLCRWTAPQDERKKLEVHHIIPNGTAEPENLITLCRYCHDAVHLLLYALGKWKYIRMR